MNQKLLLVLKHEISAFKKADLESHCEKAVYHLGRAHIISQASWIHHLMVHFLMLSFSLKRRDLREVSGQLIRIFVTVPGHVVGKVPKGNIGWSTVGLTSEKELPDDLKKIIS